MEANREAAETCVVRAEEALREHDFAKTLRLLVKAKSLYPLDNLEAKIRAVSAKVPVDEELASTPVSPGDVGDAQARKRAREEQGVEAGSKKAAGESPAGTDVSAATTTDAAAAADPPPPEYDWQTSGHEWLGAYVARMFGKRTAVGRITKWVPPEEEDGALFHVDHLDGDEEDLEDYEVTEARRACSPMCSRPQPHAIEPATPCTQVSEAMERYKGTGHCRLAAEREVKRGAAEAAKLAKAGAKAEAKAAEKLLKAQAAAAAKAEKGAAKEAREAERKREREGKQAEKSEKQQKQQAMPKTLTLTLALTLTLTTDPDPDPDPNPDLDLDPG